MNVPKTSYLLTIEAQRDPLTSARILNLVTSVAAMPTWFSARLTHSHALRIVFELDGDSHETFEHLAKHIAGLPAVTDVTRTILTRRSPVMP
jgi:hypothetical protein